MSIQKCVSGLKGKIVGFGVAVGSALAPCAAFAAETAGSIDIVGPMTTQFSNAQTQFTSMATPAVGVIGSIAIVFVLVRLGRRLLRSIG